MLFSFEIESKINVIDSFIKYTEKINILIYWMTRIFTYMERIKKYYNKLSSYALNLYKIHFFDKIQDNIYLEVNKLIKEDRKYNYEYRDKIILVIKIINSLDIKPMIISEKNKIQWTDINTEFKEKIKGKYIDNWINKYFKEETITFVKDKSNHDIHSMSAPEYIREQLKYLNEENIRNKEYINNNYIREINNINYKYLIGDIAEELAQKDTGIIYMFDNKQNEELKKAY